jgi:hypothetical protein
VDLRSLDSPTVWLVSRRNSSALLESNSEVKNSEVNLVTATSYNVAFHAVSCVCFVSLGRLVPFYNHDAGNLNRDGGNGVDEIEIGPQVVETRLKVALRVSVKAAQTVALLIGVIGETVGRHRILRTMVDWRMGRIIRSACFCRQVP